jgi:hypothetical protein
MFGRRCQELKKWSSLQPWEVLDFSAKSRTFDGRMHIWSGYSSCAAGECAADAAFRAEQQQVALPGWLSSDQKDVLHQKGQLTSRKKARCHVIKENEAKKEGFPYVGGGGVQDGDPSQPPPSPSGGFRTKSGVFEAKTLICA